MLKTRPLGLELSSGYDKMDGLCKARRLAMLQICIGNVWMYDSQIWAEDWYFGQKWLRIMQVVMSLLHWSTILPPIYNCYQGNFQVISSARARDHFIHFVNIWNWTFMFDCILNTEYIISDKILSLHCNLECKTAYLSRPNFFWFSIGSDSSRNAIKLISTFWGGVGMCLHIL